MPQLDRRQLLRSASGLIGAGAAASLAPSWAWAEAHAAAGAPTELSGPEIKLIIEQGHRMIDGKPAHLVTVNGASPGPTLRLKEGQDVRIAVTNRLDEPTSIHWHGVLVPPAMDGVPGVSFPGIPPGETFVYEFPVIQSGTCWYHSHSGFQELEGLYGPIIIEPKTPDPTAFDREYTVMLSEYTFVHPHVVFDKLKKQSGVFNFQRQTVAGLLAGRDQSLGERVEWAKMLMDPTDISDVTGAVATFIINGHSASDSWTALFKPGERVRLRFINAAGQMVFNVRIPGLKLLVVAADGQNVRPVEVDEVQIGNAETYDIIVQPTDDRAFAVVAEAVDRSGMVHATLAPRAGMTAEVPPLRARPLANMRDMAMDMSGMKPSGEGAAPAPGMGAPKPRGSDVMGDMGGMEMSMLDPQNAPQVKVGPGVQMIAPMPQDRTAEPGQGLQSVGHRVLVYKDLVALEPNPDPRTPTRALEIRLTGNMERFMWGFDGRKFSETTQPYSFRKDERVRVTLINDTMMAHPIHLHGHFVELVNGHGDHQPRKHTLNVLPGGKLSFDLTASEPGDWAMHCHMLLHMHAGMFRVVTVRPLEGEA
ncbi:MAG TPA: copper resistance system multicopper oxidase [Phenylobacterium sp.]|nr:copper resistance system multicopper oxidase [Phenylobacterium sp.]